MADTRRDQLIEFVEKEFIGPDPIDWEGLLQHNGEEILVADPPRTRYIAGILFPQSTTDDAVEPTAEEAVNLAPDMMDDEEGDDADQSSSGNENIEYLAAAEELINCSNAYKQSAISITAALTAGDTICVDVSAGIYNPSKTTDKNGNENIIYYRSPLTWNNDGHAVQLPTTDHRRVAIPVGMSKLEFDITYRYRNGDYSIYTFTLLNTNQTVADHVKDEDCFFQVRFRISSTKGFAPLPDSQRVNSNDEDYKSNEMLYRDVHNYAIGHGCAANWDESGDTVNWIESAIFPSYEIKPIVPATIDGVSLEMLKMSPLGSFGDAIAELKILCDRYEEWINGLQNEMRTLDAHFTDTANKHIQNCQVCLMRMRAGVDLLTQNETARLAFQYMNLAMLMQQLHYNLPLQRWEDDRHGSLVLVDPITMPDVSRPETWGANRNRFGKWRPFQLAFILMNLSSMLNRNSEDRKTVDLIWFPTGGGKTEAYLGLSAYTIFIRRLLDKNNGGTTILMRYTLRLLTAQQYERASSLICACEKIRQEHSDMFGDERISIGLWVGSSTTPNKMTGSDGAVSMFTKLKNDKGNKNPFVILKCPWCGAQMGPVQRGKVTDLQGYHTVPKKRFFFACDNSGCDFSYAKRQELPLTIVDEEIYERCPTLLLGTVDKFATLPIRPQASGIFGYKNGVKVTSPDLIIQDELHLISGPLGSMVGHYETMINELCTTKTSNGEIHPKIVASTATISRAKEQCNALYGCGKDHVFQFPPSGLNAGHSFFAKEDKKQNGRRYVGILAAGSSSDATTAIRLYASLLYAAKALKVSSESERDPYWTNVGYYNSIRELGQAETWIHADIDQHLDVMYKRRFDQKRYETHEEYMAHRRYIVSDQELTSRIEGDKVTASLSKLNIAYPTSAKDDEYAEPPIDICLATNMISVGLDVPRLGLMTVAGQPKTTSEYIQATSRVGRNAGIAPGLVFVIYRPSKPRDKSHYEHFRGYHARVYCHVEPTSVTPFSEPVRDRALHAIMIGMMRLENDSDFNDKPKLPSKAELERIKNIISDRVSQIDTPELDDTLDQFERIIRDWRDWNPQVWEPQKDRTWSFTDTIPLMYPAGSYPNEAWGERGISTPLSMRSVDSSCEAFVLLNRYEAKE